MSHNLKYDWWLIETCILDVEETSLEKANVLSTN